MGRKRRRLKWGEARVKTTGKIYKRKKGSYGVGGKGRYVRSKKDRERSAKRLRGKVGRYYQITKMDDILQKDMIGRISRSVLKELGL